MISTFELFRDSFVVVAFQILTCTYSAKKFGFASSDITWLNGRLKVKYLYHSIVSRSIIHSSECCCVFSTVHPEILRASFSLRATGRHVLCTPSATSASTACAWSTSWRSSLRSWRALVRGPALYKIKQVSCLHNVTCYC